MFIPVEYARSQNQCEWKSRKTHQKRCASEAWESWTSYQEITFFRGSEAPVDKMMGSQSIHLLCFCSVLAFVDFFKWKLSLESFWISKLWQKN